MTSWYAENIGRPFERTVFALADAYAVFSENVEAAENLARKYRWCLSASWPVSLIVEIGQMVTHESKKAAVDRAIVGYYEAYDWLELEKLIDAIAERGCVSKVRRKLLLDTVRLMRAGDRDGFNAASFVVPALFPQIEGIVRDFAAIELGKDDYTEKNGLSLQTIIAELRQYAEPIELAGLELIEGHLWRSWRKADAPPGKRFTRHRVLHGLAQGRERRE
jgi:hypothetical protein